MSATDAAKVMSEIRRLYAPEFANENTKTRICRGCEEPFLEWKRDRHLYCPDCAYERQLLVISGVENKRGPKYERWVREQLAFWLGEARRLGLDP